VWLAELNDTDKAVIAMFHFVDVDSRAPEENFRAKIRHVERLRHAVYETLSGALAMGPLN